MDTLRDDYVQAVADRARARGRVVRHIQGQAQRHEGTAGPEQSPVAGAREPAGVPRHERRNGKRRNR